MAERFKQLAKYNDESYAQDCPLTCEAYAVLRDLKEKKTLAQLKFKNCADKTVTGAVISITAIDQLGKRVEDIEEQHYTNLNAAPGQSFGSKSPVYFSGNIAVKELEVVAKSVLFSDGTIWQSTERVPFSNIDSSELLITVMADDGLVQCYKRNVGNDGSFIPKMLGDHLWKCSCGTINYGTVCINCKAEKETIFKYLNQDLLKESLFEQKYSEAVSALSQDNIEVLKGAIGVFKELNGYKDSEKYSVKCLEKIAALKKKEQERVEEERKQKEEQEQQQKIAAAKRKKVLLAVVCFAVVAICAILLITKVIIPNSHYNDAVRLMENGDYDAAVEAFEELQGYKDSSEKIEECKKEKEYVAAIALMESKNYDAAIKAFQSLGGYKDSTERIKECETAISDGKYDEAVKLMKSEDYLGAISIFEELDGYNDSTAKIEECRTILYDSAVAMMENGDYEDALALFKSLGSYRDCAERINAYYLDNYGVDENTYNQIANLKNGDTFVFGQYEQDNDSSNGKESIEWIVLNKDENRLLLISKYALDCQEFNESMGYITWESCSLRSWLNDTFMDEAFNDDQAEKILISTVSAEQNSKHKKTDQGSDTQDKVFLLSIEEAERYFASDNDRKCMPTLYTKKNGMRASGNGCCKWWLRTIGDTFNHDATTKGCEIVNVGEYGSIDNSTYGASYSGICVRPAIWIDPF